MDKDPSNHFQRWSRRGVLSWIWVAAFSAQAATPASTNEVSVLEIENQVDVMRAGARVWDPSRTNQVLHSGDRLRTGERSRALLRLANQTLMRLGELSVVEIPSSVRPGGVDLNAPRGIFYFFHRDQPGTLRIRTPTVSAVVRGTEFQMEVASDDSTLLSLFDGEVEATNNFGSLHLSSGETLLGRGPGPLIRTRDRPTAQLIQWCLYYPGILNLQELPDTIDGFAELTASAAAYRRGNLKRALAFYPRDRQPASDGERLYLAALLLGVGQAEPADKLLASVETSQSPGPERAVDRSLAGALRLMIAAVQFSRSIAVPMARGASEWLAVSYYHQSRGELRLALEAARQATQSAPEFGFAWERLAEMEFSFGRIADARAALKRSLEVMPENAQALALQGFLQSARNDFVAAKGSFEAALSLDGSLGNAWLGRGLCRIHTGDFASGLQDLHVAATVEPQRSMLRSYLAKGYLEAWDATRAAHEAGLARVLDPEDPTSWLYSALIHAQENRVNEAVRDLEQSKALNQNRSLYRSSMLLDQDRAMRGANLAALYRDVGLVEPGVREASQAVMDDYANYSAHLFLANSYEAIRDPRLVDLRWETASVSEYLVANLLAPPGAGTFSRTISQQEYSSLFERDGLHFASSTEYFSTGDWVQSSAAFGTLRNTSYAIESGYRSERGWRPNQDLEQNVGTISIKQRVANQDSLYFQAGFLESHSGDLTQYFNPGNANPQLRVHERQDPNLLVGYHREWTPYLHSLLLVARLVDGFDVRNPALPVLFLGKDPGGAVSLIAKPRLPTASWSYESRAEIYSAEFQQIWKRERHGVIGGARYQAGWFEADSVLGASTATLLGDETTLTPFAFSTAPLSQALHSGFDRLTLYGYYNWQPWEPVTVSAGVAYDHLRFPDGLRDAPLSILTRTRPRLDPKAGIVWRPGERTAFRSSYTRSLGGVGADQSFRLEPTEVGGFNQAYRSLIPESVVGTLAGATFETAGVGLDHRFMTGTYVGLEAEALFARETRSVGTFDLSTAFPFGITRGVTSERLDYRERSVALNLNQLLSDEWSIGVRYRRSEADLGGLFPEIPSTVSRGNEFRQQGTLQQLGASVLFNHPSGFFSSLTGLWSRQWNRGYTPDTPGDSFWQLNAFAGYRFAQRRCQLTVGLLNLTDQDYQLNPLNLTRDLPRSRTLTVSLKAAF